MEEMSIPWYHANHSSLSTVGANEMVRSHCAPGVEHLRLGNQTWDGLIEVFFSLGVPIPE